ncbi:MAG TPA: N-acetylmuramoyl-L-alanine amidase [Bryobacteraceae bacterium]|nr:N-acetylmuramoyl-L-alanine amidase [Bryobacteraceae bacterium]
MTRRLTAAMFLVTAMAVAAEARHAAPLEVTAVRCWTLADTTRIAIEITGEVHVRSDRVENPDRIFFDFVGARPSIDGKRLYSTEVGDKLLKRIRVAETVPGVTRVVLDLETAAEFSVSRLDNPSRLIIELRPARTIPAAERTLQAANREPEKDRREVAVLSREAPPMQEPPRREKPVQPVTISDPPPIKPDVAKTQAARMSAKVVTSPAVILPEPPAPAPKQAPAGVGMDDTPAPAAVARTSTVRAVPKAAHVTSDGERSLIRALGLKINRVVIDPGHGGADQGTVGHRGLMEKDLVLDVARRLGKLIEERIGSEVIYTRADDTFIPLQARTELANEKKADLFLSIHANSSPHPKIGGIEVYYLNFTRSADALDLAARENASSEKSVYELRDLIQSITLHEKIEESKEFASNVQGTLQTFETKYNAAAKNRGVKKAPFVVLIGASMPSILAEVGFLSNAREEQLLKRPDHRQRLAEALYQGVARYAQSLSHFQVAQRASE